MDKLKHRLQLHFIWCLLKNILLNLESDLKHILCSSKHITSSLPSFSWTQSSCCQETKKDTHLFSSISLWNHLGRIFLIENQNILWCLTNLQIEKFNICPVKQCNWKRTYWMGWGWGRDESNQSLNYIFVHLQNYYSRNQKPQAVFIWEHMLNW